MQFDQLRRREFITLLGGAAASPVVARAQQLRAKAYRIAIVHPSVPVADIIESGGNPYCPAFFKELRRLGYVEGQNLSVARYSAEGRENRYTELSMTWCVQIQISSSQPRPDWF